VKPISRRRPAHNCAAAIVTPQRLGDEKRRNATLAEVSAHRDPSRSHSPLAGERFADTEP